MISYQNMFYFIDELILHLKSNYFINTLIKCYLYYILQKYIVISGSYIAFIYVFVQDLSSILYWNIFKLVYFFNLVIISFKSEKYWIEVYFNYKISFRVYWIKKFFKHELVTNVKFWRRFNILNDQLFNKLYE